LPPSGAAVVVQKLGADAVSGMGIDTVKPGIYRPGCARGVGIDCDAATRVTLPHDGQGLHVREPQQLLLA
jgi:hypothetical protein